MRPLSRIFLVIVLDVILSSGVINAVADSAASFPGNDITVVDFANMKLFLPDQGMKVQLKRGIGYLSEDPYARGSKDWKIAIAQDEILRPSSATTLRLLRVECDHLTGSGSWDYVFIYGSDKGGLVRIFQKNFVYGVKINVPKASDLLFTSGEWSKNDPRCCPSVVRVSRYRWNKQAGTYLLLESSTHPRKRD
jgi:hypothetical protein